VIGLPRLAVLAVAASALGCGSQPQYLIFEAVTSPPPLAVADLKQTDAGAVTITLTKGVALAFTCTDPTTYNACTGVTAEVADPSIASEADGYLGSDGGVLVVVGLEAGATTIHVHTDGGSADIAVKIADL
jgi:hypothetical protein